jgi:hypothetical protein
MIPMSLIVRAILAIVGGWLVWLQLGPLVTMINTHNINVFSVILLVVGILLLLYAIKPNFLGTKRWWQIWK